MPEELRAAIVLFASLLDERQRRLFAGLEALKCGWGGDRRIAQLLGIDPSTVAAGRRQLVERDVELDRVRRAGGGRPRAEKKHRTRHRPPRSPDGPRDGRRPAQRTEVDTPHDRQGRRRTVHARYRHLRADRSRLLKQMGFSLRVNHKKRAGASHPNRDDQFQHIAELRERCAVENTPVISVDTKKKELVGAFKNAGAKWDRAPVLVKDHDFRSEAKGLAIPYGVYDTMPTPAPSTSAPRRNPGVRRRLHREVVAHRGAQALPRRQLPARAGRQRPPGCTPRAWKFSLQLGSAVIVRVVAHYPPATSKWNPIEHRLFCEISKNWAGRPLDSSILKHRAPRRTATDCGCARIWSGKRTRPAVTDQMTGLRLTRAALTQVELHRHRCSENGVILAPTLSVRWATSGAHGTPFSTSTLRLRRPSTVLDCRAATPVAESE